MPLRLFALLLLALTPALTGFTFYDNLLDWEAAVGAHALETFDDVPAQGIPDEGGAIVLDGFSITADGNHGALEPCGGLCPPKVEGGFFRGDIHGLNALDVPTFNQFDFHSSISAFALEVFDVEEDLIVYGDGFLLEVFFPNDDETVFVGIVLAAPITTVEFSAFYSGFSIDNVRSVAVIPEPSMAVLVGLGLIAMGVRPRRVE